MPIKLVELFDAREVALGYGVTVRIRPMGFADMKASESAALRGARDRLRAMRQAGDLATEDDEAAARFDSDVLGLAEEIMIDELVARFADGWTGVVEEDGETPAPLTRENWRKFRRGAPYLADHLRAAFRLPVEMVVREGKPSAP